MSSLLKTLEQIDAYIKGGKASSLQNQLNIYDSNHDALHNEFKLTKINQELIAQQIRTILQSLDIPEAQWQTVISQPDLSVYDFFLELSRKEYLQIRYVVELIDEKTAVKKWMLFLGAFCSTVLLSGILFIPAAEPLLEYIITFLNSASGFPVLGLISATATMLYFLYEILFDHKQAWLPRIRDAAFTLLSSSVSFVGYGLWIASAASKASFLVAGILVVSSVIDVISELICLVQEIIQYQNSTLIYHDDDTLSAQRSYYRHEAGFKKHLYAAIINLAKAVLITGIMAVSNFVPGGIILSAAAVLALALVHGLNYLALQMNNVFMRDCLQENLVRNPEIEYLSFIDKSKIKEEMGKEIKTEENENNEEKNNGIMIDFFKKQSNEDSVISPRKKPQLERSASCPSLLFFREAVLEQNEKVEYVTGLNLTSLI